MARRVVERGVPYERLCADARQVGVEVLLYSDGSGTAQHLTALGLQFPDEIRVESLVHDDDLDRAAVRLSLVLADARRG